jgi:hypothetical protein
MPQPGIGRTSDGVDSIAVLLSTTAMQLGRGRVPMTGSDEPPTYVTTLTTSSGYNDRVRFAWDPKKASANLRKHKVSFEEASTAFRDPLSIAVYHRQ